MEMGLSNVVALRWVDNIVVEKWTRKFDEGYRWSHMTKNHVESMNDVFKGIRNLHITALVIVAYYRLGSLFVTKGKKWSSILK